MGTQAGSVIAFPGRGKGLWVVCLWQSEKLWCLCLVGMVWATGLRMVDVVWRIVTSSGGHCWVGEFVVLPKMMQIKLSYHCLRECYAELDVFCFWKALSQAQRACCKSRQFWSWAEHLSKPHLYLLGMRSCLLTIELPSFSTWNILQCLARSPWWPIVLPHPPWPHCPATFITNVGYGASSQGWHQLCPSQQ